MIYLLSEEVGRFIKSTGAREARVTVEDGRLSIELSLSCDPASCPSKDKNTKKKGPKKGPKKGLKRIVTRSAAGAQFQGKTIREWAKELGITQQGVRYRIEHGGTPFGSGDKPSDKDRLVASAPAN